MLVQLPNDAVTAGYKKMNSFEFAQVFHSPSCNFTGTEIEFVRAGHGYAYVQLDPHKRVVVQV